MLLKSILSSPRLLPLVLVAALAGCGDRPTVDAGADSGSVTDAGGGTDSGADGRYIIDFDTSAGPIAVEVTEAWAPLGAARVRELVEAGFYDDSRFFRVITGFIAQFGLAGDPAVTAMWRSNTIADDPFVESNVRGTVTFATAGPNTRTSQLFINFTDNSFLDPMGFVPFGRVIEGMDNADAINAEYAQMPIEGSIASQGNGYLDGSFPNLTRLNRATIR